MLALLVGLVCGAQAPARQVNLRDPSSRTAFFLTLLYRHGRLHALNQSYNRSVADLYEKAELFVRLRREESTTFEVAPGPVWGFKFLPDAGAIRYDESELAVARSVLLTRAEAMFSALAKTKRVLSLSTVAADLGNSSTSLPAGVIELLPFLYDPQGHARFNALDQDDEQDRLVQTILDAGGREFEAYDARLKAARALARGPYVDRVQSTLNQLVQKELAPRLVRIDAKGEVAREERFSLEEVPPLVALIRGAIGLDCSMNSVAFHALIPGAKVYWIRSSFGLSQAPIGYALAIPVRLEGQVVPFVITINGPGVRARQVSPILDAVAALWSTDRVAFAREADLDYVINSDEIRDGLLRRSSRKALVRPLDPSWYELDEYLREFPDEMRYDNSYTILDFKRKGIPVMVASVGRPVSPEALAQSTNYQEVDFAALPLVERSRLGARLTRYTRAGSEAPAWAARALGVGVDQIQAARHLFELSFRRRELGPGEIRDWLQILDLTPGALGEHLGSEKMARLLQTLFDRQPRIADEPAWHEAAVGTAADLLKRAGEYSARMQTARAARLRRLRTALTRRLDEAQDLLKLDRAGAAAQNPADFLRRLEDALFFGSSGARELAFRAMRRLDPTSAAPVNQLFAVSPEFGPDYYRGLSASERDELMHSIPVAGPGDAELVRRWMTIYRDAEDSERRPALRKVLEAKGLWSKGFNLHSRVRDAYARCMRWLTS